MFPASTTALLALDLSPAEAPLLGCMAALRAWGVERLVVVHVIRVGYAQGPGLHQAEQATAHLEAGVAPLRAAGLAVEAQVRSAGVPADEILAAADEVDAALVIVGSRSHNMISRLFLGSVARELIRKARRPLLLEWVEPTAEGTAARCQAVCTDTLRRVLLATDLSAKAAAAERAAVALGARAAAFDLLTVLAPGAVAATPALPLMARAALQALQDQALAAAAGKPGGERLVEIAPAADAAPTIARFAAERGATLIVVGRHGQGWVRSALIGSTAASLCETAGRPVLLVPPAAGE